jgi:hypothetical protein
MRTFGSRPAATAMLLLIGGLVAGCGGGDGQQDNGELQALHGAPRWGADCMLGGAGSRGQWDYHVEERSASTLQGTLLPTLMILEGRRSRMVRALALASYDVQSGTHLCESLPRNIF